MKDPENIKEVAALEGIDWLGFIFYEKSPRYIGNCKIDILDISRDKACLVSKTDKHRTSLMPETRQALSLQKIGVFVNATEEQLMDAYNTYTLDYLQLHGDESPELCHSLQKRGIHLIKAFSIASENDLEKTMAYEGRVDYFLFDTKCDQYGGSGKQFDWSVLTAYTGNTPFLLSGGINPESAESINNFHHPRFAGIDLNSGFEIEPGIKDVASLSHFLSQLNINN